MKIAFPNLKSLLVHATVQEWPPPGAASPVGIDINAALSLPNSRPTRWRRRPRRFPGRIPIAQGQPHGWYI